MKLYVILSTLIFKSIFFSIFEKFCPTVMSYALSSLDIRIFYTATRLWQVKLNKATKLGY